MAVEYSLPESTTQTTEAELNSLLRRIDAAIFTLIDPTSVGSLMDYSEQGSAGHSASPSRTIDALRRLRQQYSESLADAQAAIPVQVVSQLVGAYECLNPYEPGSQFHRQW